MHERFPNVEVSTFSSLLTAAPEPKRDCRNLAVEYNALPWHRVCNRPNRCVLQHHVSMNKRGSALCTWAIAPSLSLSLSHSANSSGPPTLWRKAARRCQDPHKLSPICRVYLSRDVPANTKNPIWLVIERVWMAQGNRHIWREEEVYIR